MRGASTRPYLRRCLLRALIFAALLPPAACRRDEGRAEPDAPHSHGAENRSIKLTSAAFKEGGMIPAKYTCAGADVSPPLAWDRVPDGTRSIALVFDDPDAPAGTWTHWLVFDLPPGTRGLPQNVPAQGELQGGGRQGTNDFQRIGYGGPCPPAGTHRYSFKLYALNATLGLAPGASKTELQRAMLGHILDEGRLTGRFAKQ